MAGKGWLHKHFMLKEIFEQPNAARETILGRVSQDTGKVFLEPMKITERNSPRVERVTILALRHVVACRARRQVHDRDCSAHVPVEVDYGSEFRYRNPIVTAQTLSPS